jgi:LAGLIDADG DNA endonuclease family protein
MLVGISEAICLLSTFLISTSYLFIYSLQNLILECKESKNNITNNDEIDTQINIENTVRPQKDKDERFFEWLAGFIDGDGCFLLTKKGYASLEIVTQLRDKKCLYLIKQTFGGSVKLYSGNNYLRYRLHHKEGLLNLIDKVNGLLKNPIRILQLGKICEKYNLILRDPKPLTYNNGWLAGFFDTDGSIYLNEASGQIFITATQKNRFILEALVELYGGTIYPMVKQGAFKWTCFRKKEVLSLVNNYFKINPCRSEKLVRINMVDKFFELRKLHAHKSSANSVLGKAWKHFLIKWNSILSSKL